MALYGTKRDISLFRHVNRELMGNIISQECVYYKFKLDETKVNLYGESAGSKYYYRGVILSCLVERSPQEYEDDDFGVDDIVSNHLFMGKDPDYNYDENPINPGLEDFGSDLSVICKTHYTPMDKTQLEKGRING